MKTDLFGCTGFIAPDVLFKTIRTPGRRKTEVIQSSAPVEGRTFKFDRKINTKQKQ